VKIKLMFGDCLERMKEIPDKSIDMVLTDPPYGTTACKWDIVIPFEPMWKELKRITKDNGAICLFGSEPFSSHLRLSNIKMFKYDWIWDKITARGHLVAKKRPMQQTEVVSVFANGKTHNYFPIMTDRPKDKIKKRKTTEYAKTIIMGENQKSKAPRCVVYDKWYPKNLLSFSNATSSITKLHPTQKPVALLEYLIKTYTLENETVLDFTMGSGSTGVACKNLNRNFIGIEKDKEYFKIAKERIANSE
jgi:site-specific DNA-methyltransferase (adenine-specific)